MPAMQRSCVVPCAALLLLAGAPRSHAQTPAHAVVAQPADSVGQSHSRGRARAPRKVQRPPPAPSAATPARDYRPGEGRVDHQTGGPNPSIPSR
jgi:hypothetical protein